MRAEWKRWGKLPLMYRDEDAMNDQQGRSCSVIESDWKTPRKPGDMDGILVYGNKNVEQIIFFPPRTTHYGRASKREKLKIRFRPSHDEKPFPQIP